MGPLHLGDYLSDISTPLAASFRDAARSRAAGSQEGKLVLANCKLLDTAAGSYLPDLQDIHISAGIITKICPSSPAPSTSDADAQPSEPRDILLDVEGAVVMPGLCDAHVHCTAVTANLAALMSMPESLVTAKSAHILQGMLMRGFTTIRDAGGADWGLAQAVEEGDVLGPRLLFTGHALSQTGGHGDFRGKGEDCCACGAALRGIGRVCDGEPEVRKAARDELRRGAHCIKIMASGGVASPTDRLTNTQFSLGEITAIVEEAEACGTYVCAHAYTPAAISRAVRCGVRSIEHGNWLDEQCAEMMAAKGVFLVPTVVTYQQLALSGQTAGMPAELVAKVGDCVEQGLRAVALARKAGIKMCFGSDLLGDLHPHQAKEFKLRSQVQPAVELLQAATVNCAELFQMERQIGQVKEGFLADLLVVRGDPLEDVEVLCEEANIRVVVKGGLLAKGPGMLGMVVNERLVA